MDDLCWASVSSSIKSQRVSHSRPFFLQVSTSRCFMAAYLAARLLVSLYSRRKTPVCVASLSLTPTPVPSFSPWHARTPGSPHESLYWLFQCLTWPEELSRGVPPCREPLLNSARGNWKHSQQGPERHRQRAEHIQTKFSSSFPQGQFL